MGKRLSHSAAQLTAYGEQLLACLANGAVPVIQVTKVREYIDAHFSHHTKFDQDDRPMLDKMGVDLWNATTKHMRADNAESHAMLSPLLRTLAFLLLDAGQPRSHPTSAPKKTFGTVIRILKTANKTARSLLDNTNDYDLCSQILLRAASADATLEQVKKAIPSDIDFEPAKRASFEFWLLRTLLDFRRERVDLADMHLEHCTGRLEPDADLWYIETYATLVFDIGSTMRKHSNWQPAVEWLEKCCKVLDQAEAEQSADLVELKTSAHHEMARALLGLGDRASLDRADSIIEYMIMTEQRPTLAACILKLDSLTLRQPFPANDFHCTIRDAMVTVVLTDSTFKIVMQYIHKLKPHDIQLTCQSLDSLIQVRLLECGNKTWLEKALITRLWVCSEHAQNPEEMVKLGHVIEHVHQSLAESFTSDATYAAQALMGKCVESDVKAGRHDDAMTWCRLALHPLFAASGDQSKSKLSRRWATIALSCKDYSEAKAGLDQVPPSGKGDILTLYTAYKIGLQSGDDDLAAHSLKELAAASGQKAIDTLYACVLEAQKSGSRQHSITCLQTILNRLDQIGSDEKQQLPIVIRCTIRILMTELDHARSAEEAKTLDEIIQIMRVAGHNLEQYRSDDELGWMAKTSYNLALKYITVLDTTSTTEGLLETCIMFTIRLVDLNPDPSSFAHRLVMCHFLSAALLVVQARATDDVEHTKSLYEGVRQHVRHCLDKLAICTEDRKKGLAFQRAQAIKFDLEAIVKLEAWDELGAVLDEAASTINNETRDMDALADLVIVVHEQMVLAGADKSFHEKIPRVLQRIVNQSWRQDKGNLLKVACWIRCVFRMTVSVNPSMAMQCLEQAAAIAARDPGSAGQGKQYPQTELEWLASTAFNHAVDLFCASEQVECRRWAEAALNLAKTAVSDKGFYEHMQRSFVKLTQAQQGAEAP